MKRRDFLRATAATPLLAALPQELFAQSAPRAAGGAWDTGSLRHLIPVVSDTQILIKASFAAPLAAAPSLSVDNRLYTGTMTDTKGEHWQFHATGLQPARNHTIGLVAQGRPLCESWPLATFPAAVSTPDTLRLLLFSCAGGH